MHSFTVIHESRELKQARLFGQYVDLLRLVVFQRRAALATPSQNVIISQFFPAVNRLYASAPAFGVNSA